MRPAADGGPDDTGAVDGAGACRAGDAASGAGAHGAAGSSAGADAPGGAGRGAAAGRRRARKEVLLRLDPLVYEALARWAGEELRSTNAQIEFLLRRALAEAGRLPRGVGAIPRRGRPRRSGNPEAEG